MTISPAPQAALFTDKLINAMQHALGSYDFSRVTRAEATRIVLLSLRDSGYELIERRPPSPDAALLRDLDACDAILAHVEDTECFPVGGKDFDVLVTFIRYAIDELSRPPAPDAAYYAAALAPQMPENARAGLQSIAERLRWLADDSTVTRRRKLDDASFLDAVARALPSRRAKASGQRQELERLRAPPTDAEVERAVEALKAIGADETSSHKYKTLHTIARTVLNAGRRT